MNSTALSQTPSKSNLCVNDFTIDTKLIVEEKIKNPNGEQMMKKYAKGRFLGKVFLIREDLQDAMKSLI